MGSKIEKIEYYLPEKIITNEYLEEKYKKFKSRKVYKNTGIKSRHVVSDGETALDLAFKVGTNILQDYDKSEVDFLLYCTQSPEYYLPSGACILQDKLGLSDSIGALDITLGCSGYVYGLSIIKGLIKSGIARKVLFVTADTLTKYINENDVANKVIFGDAATATIISQSDEEHFHEFSLGTDGTGVDNLVVKNGGRKNLYNPDLVPQDDGLGNFRTDNNIYMNGPEIFNFTISHVPVTFKNTLEKNKMDISDIDYVVFHQANKYILKYLRDLCEIPVEKFHIDLEETGNTSSCTIPIGLSKLIKLNKIDSGSKILLLGFGVGYSWGGTIIEI